MIGSIATVALMVQVVTSAAASISASAAASHLINQSDLPGYSAGGPVVFLPAPFNPPSGICPRTGEWSAVTEAAAIQLRSRAARATMTSLAYSFSSEQHAASVHALFREQCLASRTLRHNRVMQLRAPRITGFDGRVFEELRRHRRRYTYVGVFRQSAFLCVESLTSTHREGAVFIRAVTRLALRTLAG